MPAETATINVNHFEKWSFWDKVEKKEALCL